MDRALRDLLRAAQPFGLPLSTRFRGIDVREGVLFQGPSGWGEFAPFDEYDDASCARWLACAVEAAYGNWPWPKRDAVPVNAIIPAVDPRKAAALAYRAYFSDGCATVKVKVAEIGQTLDDDVARIDAVRSALKSAGAYEPRIRIDANGAWSVEEAIVAIRELDQVAGRLEYVEQPCSSLAELAAVRARLGVPIAADESIRNADDPIRAARSGAADLVVIKVPPLGGVNEALRIAAAAGLPVVVSSAMDSSVGLATGVAVAAALDDLRYACGLGTGALLADDLVAYPMRPSYGYLRVDRMWPDPAALERAKQRVTPQRIMWWRRRITRAWNAGAGAKVGDLVRGSLA